MPGFSANEQRELSWLVLGCRGGLEKMGPALADRTFRAELVALRLAILIHHARRPIDTPRFSLAVGSTIRFVAPKRWLRAHPLTAHLLAKEAREWTGLGYRWVATRDPAISRLSA
jgi:exopolyphosphatase/guanosine-5'-triphosphate,3'-diphosphate pyrophosphatase